MNCWALSFSKQKTLLAMSPFSLLFCNILSFSSLSVFYIFISLVYPLVLLACPLLLVCLELLVTIYIFFSIYILFNFTGCIWSHSQISHRKTDKLKLNNQEFHVNFVFVAAGSHLSLEYWDPQSKNFSSH